MLSDMSDDLSVKLYFVNWQIRYGEHGVDLSEFDSIDHVIRREASRTWGSIIVGHTPRVLMQGRMKTDSY
jgi:hypothetical protein